jgi:DNA adenine methylase
MARVIRYPGSKSFLVSRGTRSPLLASMSQSFANCERYVEPFCGSGSVALEVIKHLPAGASVWLNDIDYGMYSLWSAIALHSRELKKLVRSFVPSVEAFYELKEKDGTQRLPAPQAAFRKIALHRTSVSGFGKMSGGPLGGRSQDGECVVASRYNAEAICQQINAARCVLSQVPSVRITNLHFRDVLAEVTDASIVYLDPPYYVKGGQLYAHNMSPDEHAELASLLHDTPADWRLSYDDCPEIRELYSWASFQELEIRYTNAVTKDKRPKNRELLISPPAEDSGDYVGMGWAGKDGQP